MLCVDELSLGLAPLVVGELLEVVRRIHATGVTLIVVEQSLNIAAELCERSIFLEKGEVRFEGSTRELMARDDIARAVFLGGNDPIGPPPAPASKAKPRSTPATGRSARRAPPNSPPSPLPEANGTANRPTPSDHQTSKSNGNNRR
jgi:ABC-type multidrug transport system ATPase subunit